MSDHAITPQTVRWGPSDGKPAGVNVFSTNADSYFIPWAALKKELDEQLKPQLFAAPSSGWTFEDWLVYVVDKNGNRYCDVWFGNNPDWGWAFDGMIRVGDSADKEPHVWQAYQRYSDGTYRRLISRMGSIDVLHNFQKRG